MLPRREEAIRCSVHPKEVVIGVCALCLTERLLILASKQRQYESRRKPYSFHSWVFTFVSFGRHRKSDIAHMDSAANLEDSFISIKLEKNGQVSWGRGRSFPWEQNFSCGRDSNRSKSVVESKTRSGLKLWQHRIGYLFPLVRWKKGRSCNTDTKQSESVQSSKRKWVRTFSLKRRSSVLEQAKV